jgi:hypothetical protein
MSLGAHSRTLAALDRHQEAARIAAEALLIILPYSEGYPERYAGLARTIAADVLRYHDATGQEPDQAMIERAAQVLAPSDNERVESEGE